ncbi:hypothetical protein P775_26550 [Puniceibacterium antarcticum]|uniref:Uncharacterized protein n=1 Tax=Puniceibacterium antarcticum TaxID=1206336 RepID=A0A2G8QZY6_9RHOB|nr:hypothetical protein P775_26550 [Puniceibacterium antarcticum]
MDGQKGCGSLFRLILRLQNPMVFIGYDARHR